LFVGCGENTQDNTIIPDVTSISIDEQNISIYSTDKATTLHSSVHYTDGSTADATHYTVWSSSDDDIATFDNDSDLFGGINNGGDATISITYDSFKQEVPAHIYALTSFFVNYDEINATGTYPLRALGSFENNETNRTIVKNIYWRADNGAEIEIDDDGVANITFETGDTNVTVTVFDDTNTSSPLAPQSYIFHIE
jgi:hypothetical protein